MKIIAVTGGAGYIGSCLVRQLVDRGDHVRVVDQGLFGFDGLPKHENVTLYPGTMLNLTTLYNAFHGADAVVHLAGLVGDPACDIDPQTTFAYNVGGTRFVHTAAKYCGNPHVLFASSCSVYGSLDKVGREDGPVNPISLYARTKYQSESELIMDPDLPVTMLRFSTVYGHSPRPRFDLVANLFTAQAVQDGHLTVKGAQAWRPFVHVDDVAGAIVAVLDAPLHRVTRRIYNVGSDDQNLTIQGLADLVQGVVQTTERPVIVNQAPDPTDLRDYRVCFDRIREEVGWSPKHNLKGGIAEMASYAATPPESGGYGPYQSPQYHNHLAEVAL